jgi:peptide/nickel transport system substrate-binding protein
VFGRPKIDEIEVRFLPEVQAMIANLLAGTVELTLGNNASLGQALQVKDQWEQQGRLIPGSAGWQNLNPQFLNPNPPILLDVQFRRALYHAIDRKTIAEQLAYGYSDQADSNIHPSFAEYRYIEPQVVRYAYDPRRATQMIEDLGYRKGSDGMFRDSAGQLLSIQIMATGDDTNSKPTFAVLDYFRTIGVTPDPEIVPNQRARDLEYRANFRSFALQGGQGYGPDGVRALLSTDARTGERNYVGGNYVRYMNPQVDALIGRYFTTIPFDERIGVLGQLVHHTTEDLIWMPLFWRVVPTFMHNRLREVPPVGDVGEQYWNAHLWDVG